MPHRIFLIFAALGIAGTAAAAELEPRELATLRSLSLSNLRPLTADDQRTNAVAFDPRAVALGRKLFFDPRLSKDGKTACATCHDPAAAFASDRTIADPARGLRRAPTLYGVGRQDFFFWDGRADSLWAQALGPLTGPLEHGLTLPEVAAFAARHYAQSYRALFGRLDRRRPERVATNLTKAIAAFELTIAPPRGALDDAADGKADLPACAATGLKVFVGKGQCASCHNGPLLTDQFFHDNQVPLAAANDRVSGRYLGAGEALASPYNCRGAFADGGRAKACPHLDYLFESNGQSGAYKTPSLRGVALRAPYMHNGAFRTLAEVVAFYREARVLNAGEPDIIPLKLTDDEAAGLECFLRVL